MFFYWILSLALAMDPVPRDVPVLLTNELIDKSKASDWRTIPQNELLYLELESGLVLIELNKKFAPNHVLNIKQLSENKYWDGQRISRVQDNYVVQWGGETGSASKMQKAKSKLDGEYYSTTIDQDTITDLEDKDVYNKYVGFLDGFPVGYYRDKTWMLHCYGAVGVGRDEAFDSGNGTELYTVIGHSPRHLDLNITLVGVVRHGIENLSSLPRGQGPMGFYQDKAKGMKIKSVRMGTQLLKKDQKVIQVMKTESPVFKQLIGARKYRQESWFHYRGGRASVCNIPIPARVQ